MNKSILISIRPEHVVKILNGEKTLELRKSVPQDFVGWVYIYVTKARKKLILHTFDNVWRIGNCMGSNENKPVNGKVVARFWFDDYDIIENFHKWGLMVYDKENKHFWEVCDPFTSDLSLTYKQVNDYIKVGEKGYVWHIDNLVIFDKPMGLRDFYVTNKGLTYKYIKEYEEQTNDNVSFRLKKAPQSWQYVWEKE